MRRYIEAFSFIKAKFVCKFGTMNKILFCNFI